MIFSTAVVSGAAGGAGRDVAADGWRAAAPGDGLEADACLFAGLAPLAGDVGLFFPPLPSFVTSACTAFFTCPTCRPSQPIRPSPGVGGGFFAATGRVAG